MKRIFVVGCPRSGTTVVQSLVGAHADIVAFPETMFAGHIFGDYAERFFDRNFRPQTQPRKLARSLRLNLGLSTASSFNALKHFCKERDLHCPNRFKFTSTQRAIEIWLNAFDKVAENSGCTHWSEKTPLHLAYVNELSTADPTAKFVHVSRGVNSVVDSLLWANQKYPTSEAWHLFGDLDYCVGMWLRCRMMSASYYGSSNHYHLNFEELLTDPHSVIKNLFSFLGASCIDPAQILADRTQSTGEVVDANETWKSKVFSELVRQTEDYRVISEKDIKTIDALIRKFSGA